MTKNHHKCGVCFFGGLGLCCFIVSIACLVTYIVFANNKSYKFLGEVSCYTLFLAILFLIIRSNIYHENKNIVIIDEKKKKKTTKVTPLI